MASVNKVILVGHLGRQPEIRAFPSGDKVAIVTIATTDKWKDKQTGEPKEATEWHRVSFHNRLADIAAQFLSTGSQIYVEGSLRTRKWTDQQGVERYSTEVRADEMQMLGRKTEGPAQEGQSHRQAQPPRAQSRADAASRPSGSISPSARPAPTPPRSASGFNDDMEDIPFQNPFRSRAYCLAA